MAWAQGEHVALIGSTGTGKTELLGVLASLRRYVVICRVKSDTLAWRSFKRTTDSRTMDRMKPGKDGSLRLLLHPPAARRADEFRSAISRAYREGGWTIGFDELFELQQLKLEAEIIQLYSEGRSERVTCIGGMQRPSWITNKGVQRWAISQPTHAFVFQTRDERDRALLKDIYGGAIERAAAKVPRFQFVYLNLVTGRMGSGDLDSVRDLLGIGR